MARAFFARSSLEVAPELLNKVLRAGERAGRIVEVEAYLGADDPASHAFRGRSARNGVMFGPPGHLYVYFSYGVHWCANVVCGEEGTATAVLLRALAPVAGVAEMFASRPAARRPRDLCSGPGKLTQALGIGRAHDGADLVSGDRGLTLEDDGMAPPVEPVVAERVGISVAAERPWRWYVPGEPNVSRR
ncbi:MAG: DNA-3-methyladenine glycosylase [Acidimicrobiia bacterium]|nr:DNA-3-methyladenine glycosylase [Acidimicrobiia bacterium]